jgi:hypothetical protein
MAENVHQAINQVMNFVGYVQKQKAAQLNYTYAGEAALISALRPQMVEAGLYVAVVAIKDVVRGQYTTAKGSVMNSVDLVAVIRFTHAPSATFIDVEALGSGADSGDKASNKALTGAYKYALRQTFCIETGDDPDNHVSEPRAAAQKKVNPATGEITNGTRQPAQPATRRPAAPPTTGALLARIYELRTEALNLGIIGPSWKVDPAATEQELTKIGTDLAAKVKAAKQKEPAHA